MVTRAVPANSANLAGGALEAKIIFDPSLNQPEKKTIAQFDETRQRMKKYYNYYSKNAAYLFSFKKLNYKE